MHDAPNDTHSPDVLQPSVAKVVADSQYRPLSHSALVVQRQRFVVSLQPRVPHGLVPRTQRPDESQRSVPLQ